jgi:ribosomal protein L9
MEIKTKEVLKRIGDLEREIEYIKRDLMHLRLEEKPKQKPSLFGSVRGGDITDEMIEDRIILDSGEVEII